MYDWSSLVSSITTILCVFQLLLKGCTIEATANRPKIANTARVSVVVERMYDWSKPSTAIRAFKTVSVVVERMYDWSKMSYYEYTKADCFSCCWKDVRLKRWWCLWSRQSFPGFSCCWKDVRLKPFSVK